MAIHRTLKTHYHNLMACVISKERYISQVKGFQEAYLVLREKFPEDENFRNLKPVIMNLKKLYPKDKVYAVKQMNYLEKHQVTFVEERRALIVKIVGVLQKLILHKKLQPTQKSIARPRSKPRL